MKDVKSKERNCSIDFFRYICAVMVVAIHTHPFYDLNERWGYLFTMILPRISTPYFFAVAGYFYVQKLERNQKPFFSYIKKLAGVYFIWSFIYYLVDYVSWGRFKAGEFLNNCVYSFFITGSHYHLWFFPGMFFAVCVTTLLWKTGCRKIIICLSIVLYIVGCLGCAYYNVFVNIPVSGCIFNSLATFQFGWNSRILLMAVPFFICGYLVYRLEKNMHKISDRQILYVWSAAVIIYFLEIRVVTGSELQANIIITLSLYLLVIMTLLILLRNPLSEYALHSNKCRVAANFTYYAHPLCMRGISYLSKNILHRNITETPLFFMTVCLSGVGGWIIYRWNNKWANRLVY